ncbi:hypothetical protein Tco_0354958 [Tanacetum coccineum]
MSFECNNIKLAIRNDKSEVICVMCKQCLITTNHDVCVLNYVNGINSRADNQNAHVSNTTNQKKHKAKVKKSKKLGSKERLASPRPRKPRTFLRWSPTRRTFNLSGKLIQSSCPNLFMVCRLGLLQAHNQEYKVAHQLCLEVYRVKAKQHLTNPNCSKLKAEATPASYGFAWANKSRKYEWEALCSGDTIATACYTQNRSLIHQRFNKTPYELINGRKPDISFLHVFGALCYPKNDHENIGKLGAKGLDLTYAPSTITSQKPTERELNLLFEAMYDDYIGVQPSDAPRTAQAARATQDLRTPNASTRTLDSTPTPTNSSSQAPTTPNTS